MAYNGVGTKVSKPLSAEKKAAIKIHLAAYVAGGGFPEAVKNKDVTLVEQYYKDIIYRDIISRHSLRNSREFKELCVYLSSNIGAVCSYENLAKMIHARNITTVKNYLEYLESAYMFFRLPMFDFSVRRQIYNPGKFYCVDTGMAKATGFEFSENAGRIYENAVFLELKRRGREIYYWKSKAGNEVDFVCREGMKITEAIQVCLDISTEKTREREIRSLLESAAVLKAKTLTVVTKDEEKTIKQDGFSVRVVPMWKWLLEK
jgi:predicted AAA+ superfamily ATPase